MAGARLVPAACPVCAGGRAPETLATFSTGVRNGFCPECGLAFLSLRPDAETLAATYSGYGQSYGRNHLLDPQGQTFQAARSRLTALAQVLPSPPASVLEIGCGYGHFLSLFPVTTFRAGVEPSAEQAAFARNEFGLREVRQGVFQDFSTRPESWPKDGFDLAASFHVLEHVEDPAGLVTFARRFLKPGGLLYLSAPNLFDLSPDLIELLFLARGLHLQTFSPTSLGFLLRKSGFQIVSQAAEAPTAMLRSSFLVLARPAEPDRAGPNLDQVDQARRAARRFHHRLIGRLANLRQGFDGLAQWGLRAAVYGGGFHTLALLELTGIDRAGLVAVIDDDPAKQGRSLLGLPVLGWPAALGAGIEVVIVSSLASEEAILARLEGEAPAGVRILGLYRDLMTDNGGFR